VIVHEFDEVETSVYDEEPLDYGDYSSEYNGVSVQKIHGLHGMKTQAEQEELLTLNLVPREGEEDNAEDGSDEEVKEVRQETMWLGLEDSVEKESIDEDVDDGCERDQRESHNLVNSLSEPIIDITQPHQEGLGLLFICNLYDVTFQTGCG